MAVVRVGDAFSARVQRVALIACRKLFPLCARTLLNVHRGVHRKVGGTLQATANCRRNRNTAGTCPDSVFPAATATCSRNTAGNTLPSGHVQRAAYFQPYSYGQLPAVYCGWIATTRTRSLRAGSCEARTLPPAPMRAPAATTCSCSAGNTRVCCCARSSLDGFTAKRQALEGRHARRVRLSWKGNLTCGCLVTAPFRRNHAAAGRFCRHAAARSRMATWPSSVLATRSPPGSSASRLLPAVSSFHCVPGRC